MPPNVVGFFFYSFKGIILSKFLYFLMFEFSLKKKKTTPQPSQTRMSSAGLLCLGILVSLEDLLLLHQCSASVLHPPKEVQGVDLSHRLRRLSNRLFLKSRVYCAVM